MQFDEWASPQHRKYLGIFATYNSKIDGKRKTPLLSVTPLNNESNSTAANLANTTKDVLKDYNKSIDGMLYSTGDNVVNTTLIDKYMTRIVGSKKMWWKQNT